MQRLSKAQYLLGFNLLFVFFLTITIFGATKKLIDLDFKNADVKDVLRVLAAQNGANFLIDEEVSGTVTIHLTKVTFEDALNIVTVSNNLRYSKQNNVYQITQIDNAVLNVEYKDNTLSVEAQNAKIAQLTQVIAQKTGLNLVPDPNIKDRITIRLLHIPIENALESILLQANCITEKKGAVTFIRKRNVNQQDFMVNFQNDLLSIDAQNVPLSALTRVITEKTGVSVVPNQDVNNSISIFLQNLPLTDALTLLCNANNLQLMNSGDAWRIARAASLGPSGQNLNINYDSRNKLFDVEVQSASLTTVIGEMARKANLDLVILAQVNWTVNNIRLHKLSFEQVLEYLFKGTIYTYKLQNNIYMIGDGMTVRPENSEFTTVKVYPIKYIKADVLLNTLPSIFSKQNFVLLTDKNALIVTAPDSVHKLFEDYLSRVDIDDNQDRTAVIKVKYLKAEDVLKYLPASISKSDLVVVKEINSITVTGPQNLINQVQQYIAKIDQVNPMIVFDVMVVLITTEKDFEWTPNYSVNVGNGIKIGIDLGTGIYEKTDSTLIKLKLLLQNKLAKILQNPTITTLNGYPANFSVSTKRTYTIQETSQVNGEPTTTSTTKTVDSGVSITITPWVADDKITMEIKPKITEYGAIPNGQTLPETTEHATETTVRVNDNQTVILSGLKNTRQEKTVSKIPLLGDIPLIGLLFKSTSTKNVMEEFVIVITPRLVYNDQDQESVVQKFNDNASTDLKKTLNPEQSAEDPKKKKNGK
jgi:type II secretory pathway component GspD/PulD (secretin)